MLRRLDPRPFDALPPAKFYPGASRPAIARDFRFDPVSIDTLKAKGIAFEPVYANH